MRKDTKVKKHIKTFAALCSLVMVFGSFSFAAFADEEPADPQPVPFANGLITQTDINLNGGKMPEAAGTYTLTENVTVSVGAKIETQDASVTIDLNGYTITYTGTESFYVVGKVRGTDGDAHNSNTKTAPIDFNNTFTGVTLTIEGPGTITGEGTSGTGSKDFWINGSGVGTDNYRGGCVLVEWSSSLILDGATITDFEATDEGGAICVSNGATFVMNGGAITNCYAGKGGGAISGNASSASHGPNGENIKASVTINDGLISGNEAGQLGGGVRINRCHLYLNGGEITNNNVLSTNSQNGGGGIEILHNKNGHDVLIQGSPKVYGNKAMGSVDVERSNIFLDDCKITLNGDLSSSAKLRFSTKSLTAICFDINGKSYSLDSFVCDHENYISYVSGSNIKIKSFTMPKVNGYMIGIGGQILFNVYVDLGSAAESAVSINYTYSYKKTGSSEMVVNKDVTGLNTDSRGKYFVIPVESACMTAPITITLTYQGKDKVYTTTVEDVAYESASINSAYTDVVKALLTYGGYAQVQLKINTDNLPTVSGVNFNNPYSGGIEGASYSPESDPDNAYYGSSVSFLSETCVKMYFKKSVLGSTAPAMTVTYADNSTETISGTPNGSYYEYIVKGSSGTGFPATQYNVTYSYSIGNIVSGEYSVNTYLKVIRQNSSNAAMVNLVEAYYNFAQKCSALTH